MGSSPRQPSRARGKACSGRRCGCREACRGRGKGCGGGEFGGKGGGDRPCGAGSACRGRAPDRAAGDLGRRGERGSRTAARLRGAVRTGRREGALSSILRDPAGEAAAEAEAAKREESASLPPEFELTPDDGPDARFRPAPASKRRQRNPLRRMMPRTSLPRLRWRSPPSRRRPRGRGWRRSAGPRGKPGFRLRRCDAQPLWRRPQGWQRDCRL